MVLSSRGRICPTSLSGYASLPRFDMHGLALFSPFGESLENGSVAGLIWVMSTHNEPEGEPFGRDPRGNLKRASSSSYGRTLDSKSFLLTLDQNQNFPFFKVDEMEQTPTSEVNDKGR